MQLCSFGRAWCPQSPAPVPSIHNIHVHVLTCRFIDLVYGERRIDKRTASNPYLRASIPYLTTLITNPTGRPRGSRNFNTSRASGQHFGHYVGAGSAKNDFEFAFKVRTVARLLSI